MWSLSGHSQPCPDGLAAGSTRSQMTHLYETSNSSTKMRRFSFAADRKVLRFGHCADIFRGHMRRRGFITLLGSTAVMGSLAVHAQLSGRMRRIGIPMSYSETDPDAQTFLSAFRENSRSSAGSMAETCSLRRAGLQPATWSKCSGSRTSLSRHSLTFFSGILQPLPLRCDRQHEPFLSSLHGYPTR